MRVFIAIDISENLKKEILKVEETLESFKNINLVSKENLHVTIKFLGEVASPEKIIRILENVEFKSFELTSNQIGFFPNDKFIRVMWVGFKKCEELLNLQKQVDDFLKPLFKSEKDYVPHVTLARLGSVSSDEKIILKKVNNLVKINEDFKIKSFKLMKSTLTNNGPVYELIKLFKAKGL